MTADLYERGLEALFGRHYVIPAEAAMSIDRKTVGRYCHGERKVPDAEIDKVIALLIVKHDDIRKLVQELRRERAARAESAARGQKAPKRARGRQRAAS